MVTTGWSGCPRPTSTTRLPGSSAFLGDKPMTKAFTLIELLVVITIIVVLLALLTPALDRAIYQAELAVCGANLHGIASGAQVYAVNHKRRYPWRDGIREESAYSADTIARDNRDDRPVLRDFMSLDILIDALVDEVDLGLGESGSLAVEGGHFFATYQLWFGWHWKFPAPQKGMDKLGDRFSFTDDTAAPPRTTRFR